MKVLLVVYDPPCDASGAGLLILPAVPRTLVELRERAGTWRNATFCRAISHAAHSYRLSRVAWPIPEEA